MKFLKRTLLFLIIVIVVFRFTCGIFVIQPIGAIPEGGSVAYWRVGTNLPFITSPDGLSVQKEGSISILSRIKYINAMGDILESRKLFSFGYSDWLFSLSKEDHGMETSLLGEEEMEQESLNEIFSE